MSEFKSNDNWEPFYGDVQEAKPLNAPKPLGKEFTLHMFVYSDHAGDKSDRRSRKRFMIFMNMAMINWHTKKQATVEGTVFGALARRSPCACLLTLTMQGTIVTASTGRYS